MTELVSAADDRDEASFGAELLQLFDRVVQLRRDELTELDRLAGDGDFGENFARAVRSAAGAARSLAVPTFAGALGALSEAMSDMGGTSGPLFAVWFGTVAEFTSGPEGLTVGTFAAGAREGTSMVQSLGGARVGDKTMVDAMAPASLALDAAHAAGSSLPDATAAAGLAAHSGAAATAGHAARRGRASYVGDASVGVVDPGALGVALFFDSLAEAACHEPAAR